MAQRATTEKNPQDGKNIMMLANMFLGYQNKHHRFDKYNLNITDKLNNPECDLHIHRLAKETNINEYYIAILTDMMPYVCFANYLYHNIKDQNNIWNEYAKKYGASDSSYVQDKLANSFRLANHVLDKKLISPEKAKSLFREGMKFESYFIEEAMNGTLKSQIIHNNRENYRY